MNTYLFGYESTIEGCCHRIVWIPDRHGKTWWHLNGFVTRCAYCRGESWYIIDDVEHYLERDPDERRR